MNSVITKSNGCILQIILNRPDKRNALNLEIIQSLTHIFNHLPIYDHLRLIHISGSGPDFCAGADLQWMASSCMLSKEDNYLDANILYQLYKSMKNCSIPIITQVHGHIYGGGIGLCSASDIVMADQNSVFALSETKHGLIPAIMMPFIIDQLGKSRTRELVITARAFSAIDAHNYGLVHFITTKRDQSKKSNSIIQEILTSAPEAIQECRRLINNHPGISPHELVGSLATKRVSEEAQEGLVAFLEKRPPKWSIAHALPDEVIQ